MYKNFAKQVLRKIRSILLDLRIFYKWRQDCNLLPLSPAHWELYAIVHRLYWLELNDFPNLIDCRDFNDRIQWLKLFDQSREIIRCSDKILVKDYIRERLGDNYIVRLYQVHNHFNQIDFASLPDSFVIKTNHDSGSVLLVRDKNCLDKVAAELKFEKSLRKPYGWVKGEWAYSYVEPKVFVEEYINPDRESPPPDYKFQCVEGKVRFCRYTFDRGIGTKEIVVDRNGIEYKHIIDEDFLQSSGFVIPTTWNTMIQVAEKLSYGFKCVRIDLYSHNNKIYVGEMTFFPKAGRYKGEGQKKFGTLLDFDRSTFKPILIPVLEKNCSRFLIYPESFFI